MCGKSRPKSTILFFCSSSNLFVFQAKYIPAQPKRGPHGALRSKSRKRRNRCRRHIIGDFFVRVKRIYSSAAVTMKRARSYSEEGEANRARKRAKIFDAVNGYQDWLIGENKDYRGNPRRDPKVEGLGPRKAALLIDWVKKNPDFSTPQINNWIRNNIQNPPSYAV